MIIIGPLWFLNLILIGLNLILSLFIFITDNKININFLLKKNITEKSILIKSEIPNLNEITDRDIFKTISPSTEQTKLFIFESKNLVNLINPPMPPHEIPIEFPTKNEKNLLPPLQIILRGTIITDNPLNNKVLIEHVRNKDEKEYIIGDIIEDAQIIYISKSKVTLIRSNGQEENIYLNKLLKIEEEGIANTHWNTVIQTIENNTKIINLDLFSYKIKSLSSLIEELNLITLFENNIPIGCLIQNTKENSLAYYLGFEENDIIISINNILINQTEERKKIVELILNNKNNKNFIISVTIKRNNTELPLYFRLKKNETKNITKTIGVLKIHESPKESI